MDLFSNLGGKRSKQVKNANSRRGSSKSSVTVHSQQQQQKTKKKPGVTRPPPLTTNFGQPSSNLLSLLSTPRSSNESADGGAVGTMPGEESIIRAGEPLSPGKMHMYLYRELHSNIIIY